MADAARENSLTTEDVGPYEQCLALTEEIERVIRAEEFDRLPELLDLRSAAFDRVLAQPLREAEEVIRRIMATEERCMELAARKKEGVQQELGGVRKQKRLERAYSQTR